MEEFNIKDLKINFEISSLLAFLESKKEFEIDVYGNIYALNEASKTTPLVFRGKVPSSYNETELTRLIETIFGKEYNVQMTASHCTLSLVGAWQSIIGFNQDRMSYFDHQTDGIEVFEDKELEDIGWQAVSLNINYRTICSYLEKQCQGTFVYYDNGMHFNGFVIFKDMQEAKAKMYECVQLQIEEKIKNEELILEESDDDEKEALAFFNYKGY